MQKPGAARRWEQAGHENDTSHTGCVSTTSQQEQRALHRARQAVRCLPFRLSFYQLLDAQALSSTQIAAHPNRQQLSRLTLNANRTEDLLIWLIQLGVLRREVDGQGLTERVRLTPMGRSTIAPWSEAIPPGGVLMRLKHWLRQHRPRI
jgi:hypothetical protein